MAFVWSLAVKNLRRRKLRTGLTVSGIVVGVGLMLVLLSLTSGMESQARILIRGLSGADVVVTNATLLRGFGGPSEVPLGPSTLSESILDLIREIPRSLRGLAPTIVHSVRRWQEDNGLRHRAEHLRRRDGRVERRRGEVAVEKW